ncbi:MAG: ParB/RepB/Spo0J family partition protein [Desulfobulbaceae bacterium]|nr:ParB/RepB/Spo0J family partition protein [Desulfobulbaceae bacterium]
MAIKSVLGRGVEALLPEDLDQENKDRFFLCDIDKIEPNKNQPRTCFDEEKLASLADSIREKGIIQPLLVTRAKGNRYHLIAGERRLRAAKLADQEEVPVVVMAESAESENLELALIENIQRHDLNPIEEATAYSKLLHEFNLTQEEVAKKVGRKRSTVTNVLRLLKLPPHLQNDVATARISEGHARVLLRFTEDPTMLQEIRDKIIQQNLSVRETERLCKKQKSAPIQKTSPKPKPGLDELPATYCKALTNQMTNHLNTKIRVVQNGSRGKLEIEYYSSDDLDRLVSLLSN